MDAQFGQLISAWIPVVILACSLAQFVLVALAVAWAARRRGPVRHFGGVSILKPLSGLDDDLEKNLESFATLDYPQYELLLAAADEQDPALAVARRVQQRHPECAIQVFAFPQSLGVNPKTSLLIQLEEHARYDLLVVSDSNVRAAPQFLARSLQPLSDPRVGLVHNAILGTGEETIPAVFENMHLTCFSGVLGVCIPLITGIQAVVGKNMILRRQALAEAGGFRAVRHTLCDDHELALRFLRRGWNAALADEFATVVNRRWDVGRLAARHVRWNVIRWKLSPLSYPAELAANPVFLACAAAIVLAPLMTPSGWLTLAASVLLKAISDAVASRGLRGIWLKPVHQAALPFKDLLMGLLWFAPFFIRRVRWRSGVYLVTPKGRMVRAERLDRRRASRPLEVPDPAAGIALPVAATRLTAP